MSQPGEPQLSLTPIHFEVRALIGRGDGQRARAMLEDVYKNLVRNIEHYVAPPDIWFNMSVLCSRLRMSDAELMMWQAGLHTWPEDVDLLCALLQEYFGAAINIITRRVRKRRGRACQTSLATRLAPISGTGPLARNSMPAFSMMLTLPLSCSTTDCNMCGAIT